MQSKRTIPFEVNTLNTAWEAFQRGDRERAHQLSKQILGTQPDNPDAWLLYAKSAPTKREEFQYLLQAKRYFPRDARLGEVFYQEMQRLLEQDPFLAYQDETADAYQVFSREEALLNIPKGRATPEPYPTPRPPKIQKAYRYLILAFLGLMFSGLGALFFAPAAGIQAWQELRQNPIRSDRARAGLILFLAVCLAIAGMLLVYLLWLHITG